LYKSFHKDSEEIIQHNEEKDEQHVISSNWDNEEEDEQNMMVQLHTKYILAQLKTGMLLIDQQRAHERILYEGFLKNLAEGKGSAQQLLFPETIDFTNADAELINELNTEIRNLGFDISKVGRSSFVVTAIPSELKEQNVKKIMEGLLEQFKLNESELKLKKRENLATSMARSSGIKAGKKLTYEEMKALVDQLFACEMPYSSPSGKTTLITLNLDDLNQQFD